MTHPPSSTLSAPLEALLFTPAPPGIGPEIRVGRDDLNSLDDRLAGFFAATGLPTGSEPLIRCAVLLWHDHLDPAHELAQEIANPSGSWLHGIMHRREPDYWNAKYWFQRVGNHPAAASLSHLAGALLAMPGHAALKTRLLPRNAWSHSAFVDYCEQIADSSADDPARQTAIALQAAEIRALLGHFSQSEK